jgi:hypothetical protein
MGEWRGNREAVGENVESPNDVEIGGLKLQKVADTR